MNESHSETTGYRLNYNKVLITGITGFVGSHMAEFYTKRNGTKVYGLVRHRSSKEMLAGFEDQITFVEGDLTDSHSINRIVNEIKPDVVHHLAAQSYVPSSWIRPSETMQVNLMGSLNLLEAIRNYSPNTVIQVASTSEVYGDQKELPLKETSPVYPASPYAVSKLAMENLAAQYHYSYGTKSVLTRAFNHFGPRRGEQFVESKIAKAVVMAKKGKRELTLGNIENQRDWTDVRDIVNGYFLSTNRCEYARPYNICSGYPRTVKSVVEDMKSLYGLNKLDIKYDSSILRPSDVSILQGDSRLFRKHTGWKQEYAWEKSCKDILTYWEEKIK